MLRQYKGHSFSGGHTSLCKFYYRENEGDLWGNIQDVFNRYVVKKGFPESNNELHDVIMVRGRNRECLYTREGERISTSGLFRKAPDGKGFYFHSDSSIDVGAVQARISTPVVYGGVLFNHWGHFLIESTARLWMLSQQHCLDGYQCLYSWFGNVDACHENIREYLRASDIRFFDKKGIPDVVFLERCIVPMATFSELNECYTGHGDVSRAVARSVLYSIGNDHDDKPPVYLSRAKLKQPGQDRYIINEGELEDVLRKFKFDIIYPELLSFSEQVILFNSRSVIVGCWGSALHGALLCTRPDRLTTFTISEYWVPENSILLDSAVGHESTYISALRPRFRGVAESSRARELVIDVEAVIECLKIEGVL